MYTAAVCRCQEIQRRIRPFVLLVEKGREMWEQIVRDDFQ